VIFLVKGVTRRVIVIKSPDPRLFEEAIFIVKEGAFCSGVTNKSILNEAQAVADRYIRQNLKKKRKFCLPPAAFIGIGIAITALAWLITSLI
jgi:hypothetical protein